MAEISKFFNSAPGDPRKYQAADFAEYFSNVLSTGLLHTNKSPGMQVSVGAGLTTIISPGKAVMDGYSYENTTPLTLEHNLPESDLDRIDRVVLRLDKRNQSRYIRLFVLTGDSSTDPVAPQLTRDEFIYELSLAQIRVRANTSSLNVDDLIDERLNEDLCGLVSSLITVPTSQFLEQWNTFFNNIKNETTLTKEQYEQAWQDWFEKQQTEGFVMQDELQGGNVRVVTLQRGENLVEANRNTPASIGSFEGKTEIQLVPPFDSSAWFSHNVSLRVDGNDNRKAEVIFLVANGQTGFGLMPVEGGKAYDIHFDFELPPYATLRFAVSEYNLNSILPQKEHTIPGSSGVFTLTTDINTTHISFNLSDDQAYSFLVNKLLIAGNGQEPSRVSSIQPVRFPSIHVKKTDGKAVSELSIHDYFYEGDRLEVLDDNLVKVAKNREVTLIGEENYVLVGLTNPINGMKSVSIRNFVPDYNAIPNSKNITAVKTDSKVLKSDYYENVVRPDMVGLGDNHLILSISNEDSGWGDNYTPIVDEIKAYFMGWRMYDGSSGQPINGIYNRTDGVNKRWAYRDHTGTLVNSGTGATVPMTLAPISSKWQPYRLIYNLAQQEVVPVQLFGELQLDKGVNGIELSEGMVTREFAKPYNGFSNKKVAIINSTYNNEASSILSAPTQKILGVYKNGIKDNSWTIQTANAYGKERARTENYDPNAQYTVDYLIMSDHSVPIGNATIVYSMNIGSIVDDLIKLNAENKEALQLINMSPIQDGIIVEEGTNANGSYIRWANGFQICTLPAKSITTTSSGSFVTTWTLPASFRDLLYAVSPSISSNRYEAFGISIRRPDELTAEFRGAGFGQSLIYSLSAIAIGWWK